MKLRIILPLVLLAPLSFIAQNLLPFFAPSQPAGSIEAKLCPVENVSTGSNVLVTFGLPFTRGSVPPEDLSKIRVVDPISNQEIAAHVEASALWRSTQSTVDQQSVRVANIQLEFVFDQPYPAQKILRIEWGGQARLLNLPELKDPHLGWHLVENGSFIAADSVYEPDVFVLLPPEIMCAGALKGTRMLPYHASVPEMREDPYGTDTVSQWPLYAELDHAQHNFLFTLNNDDDPLVTVPNQIPYKTDFEPWLYDRSAAMFCAYFRSGHLYDLRQAVRNEQFYLRHLYRPGQAPDYSVGLFDLKVTDPFSPTGGNSAMYSYAESLAYTHWLTGDPHSRTAIDWVVNAHEKQDEHPRWSPTAPTWTERHTAFRLLCNAIGWEVTGNQTYRDSMLAFAYDFLWHQSGAGGQLPSGAVTGGLFHYGSQHGDGSSNDFTASSWMSVLTQEAMLRVYFLTEDPEIAFFIKQMGNFFNKATKFDDQHLYDTYLDGAPLWYGDYMMLWSGQSDERDGSEVEHALEMACAAAWASYFSSISGSSDTTLTGLVKRLFFTYDQGVNHWTRPPAPASGKAAFRVSPPRKYAWEYRPSGSFSWLMGQLESTVSQTTETNATNLHIQANNPFSDEMLLSFSVPQNTDLRLQLFDSKGKLVIAKQYRGLPAGPNSLRVETAGLPVGSYGVQVMTNTQMGSVILIKS